MLQHIPHGKIEAEEFCKGKLSQHFLGGSGIHFFPKWAWAACL